MIRIYNYKTGKLREVILEPGEKNYLCKLNLRLIQEQTKSNIDVTQKEQG